MLSRCVFHKARSIYIAFVSHLYRICIAFVSNLYRICIAFVSHLYRPDINRIGSSPARSCSQTHARTTRTACSFLPVRYAQQASSCDASHSSARASIMLRHFRQRGEGLVKKSCQAGRRLSHTPLLLSITCCSEGSGFDHRSNQTNKVTEE